MATPTCLPDRYLSQPHLDGLFKDFSTSLASGQSEAAIFSSVVNNVRHVYMAALLGANEDILAQFKEAADELARLKRQRSEGIISAPKNGINISETSATSDAESPAPTPVGEVTVQAASDEVEDVREEEICWPANTFSLHIGSSSVDNRRDMPDWKPMDQDGWTERLAFQVFKYEEPGTIRIQVTEDPSSHWAMVSAGQWWSRAGWKTRLTFYAYGEERPGTKRIWVAYRADPDRCIFLLGKRSDKLEGWERRLEFWVPKEIAGW